MNEPFGIVPVNKRDFAAALTPCLILAAGATMGGEARREWLEAAYKALRIYPADLIARGAEKALRVADHPSKIVPIIVAEIDADFSWRCRVVSRFLPLPADRQEQVTAEERRAVGDGLLELVRRLEAMRNENETSAVASDALSTEQVENER